MKKATLFLNVILTMVLVGIMTPTTSLAGTTWVTGSADGVNVRNPQTHEQVGLVRPGTLVDVLYEDDYWLHINYGGQEAIVYKEYFTPADGSYTTKAQSSQTTPRNPLEETMPYIGVVTKTTKVWVDPDKGPEKAGNLEAGTGILIRQVDKYWIRIQFEGHLRYIPRDTAQVTGINLPGDGKVYKLQIPEKFENSVIPIREEANKESKILAKKDPGDFIRIVDSLDGWSLVVYDVHGNMGYVSNWYLKEYHGMGS